MERYCAYQERSQREVRTKLLSLEVYGDTLEDIICDLIENNFLNEMRYAEAYVSGKFRIKKWGISKIKFQLKQQQVSDYCIRKAIATVDPIEYEQMIVHQVEKQSNLKPNYNYQQYYNWALRKGYEWDIVKSLIEKHKSR